MAELKVLRTFEHEVQENLIEILESYLERAKSGEFDAIMVVTFKPGGEGNYQVSKGFDMLRKIGALELLKQKALDDE